MKSFFIAGAILAGVSAALGQNADTRWDSYVLEFERHDAVTPPPRDAYLFIGSSSIRLWHSLVADFPHLPVINRGFGGSQLSDVIALADRLIVPYQPKMIVLYCGDNDIASGHKSPAGVLALFKELVAKLHQSLPRTSLGYIAMKPAPSTWAEFGEKMRVGNQLIRDYILTDPTLSYIDVFTPMLAADGTPRPELFVSDHEHLNPSGYALWRSIVTPYLE